MSATVKQLQSLNKTLINETYAAYNVFDTTYGKNGITVFIMATPEQIDALAASPNCSDYEPSSWDVNGVIVQYDVFMYHEVA